MSDREDIPEPTPFGIALADFSWNLYRQISSSGDSNVFVSPLSISFALSMLYAGASENTKDQLKKLLFGNQTTKQDDELHSLYQDVMGILNKEDPKYKLHLANRVYVHELFVGNLLPKFTEIVKEKYSSDLQAVDFHKKAEVAKTINAWVSEKTNDKIKDLIAQDSLTDLTRLVLINAIYFKGDWKKKFDPNYTDRQKFYVSENKTVEVEMMSIVNSDFYYTSTEEYQLLGMQYSKGQDSQANLYMYVFLPYDRYGLANMEMSLDGQTILKSILQANWERDLDCVAIPKFKLEETVNLVSTLKQLGVGDMFEKGIADFSNINGEKNLFVSDVIHKAFIEVNEEGTEAAAATACMMMDMSGPMDPSFIADYPFLFAIIDKKSTSILFMGRFTGNEECVASASSDISTRIYKPGWQERFGIFY